MYIGLSALKVSRLIKMTSVLQFKIRQILQNVLVALQFCEIPMANGLALKNDEVQCLLNFQKCQ